jgi:hypothetical protein
MQKMGTARVKELYGSKFDGATSRWIDEKRFKNNSSNNYQQKLKKF